MAVCLHCCHEFFRRGHPGPVAAGCQTVSSSILAILSFFFLIFLWTFNRLAVHHHRAEGPGSPGGRRTGVTKEPGWSRGGEDECTVLSC